MLTTPRDAKPDQNGLGGLAVRLLCAVGRSAACTVHTAARLKASGMAITGTVPEPKRPSSFGASSSRCADVRLGPGAAVAGQASARPELENSQDPKPPLAR